MKPGEIFFAWVGGPRIDAFELLTTGDVWGGSITKLGTTWGGFLSTAGDVTEGSNLIDGMTAIDGLIAGATYDITGPGIPEATTIVYDGDVGGTMSAAATADGPQASLTLSSDSGRTLVQLSDDVGLENGLTYAISGGGIPANTNFTYGGSTDVTISQGATATAEGTPLQISRTAGRDVIKNIADTTGLVDGQTYEIFGQGVPSGTTGTFQDSDSTLQLSIEASATGFGVQILISSAARFPDGGAFDELYARFDERVLSFIVTEAEGEFPTLEMDIPNPHAGLLSGTRSPWGWLSYSPDGITVVPLFHGRVIGAPKAISGEAMRVNLVSRPEDYLAQKHALAAAMRVLPYWDPVWLVERENEPDTVLETRTALWNIDRLTLEVSVSDILTGEDGTVEVSRQLYPDLEIQLAQPPLRRINCTATVNWDQTAAGDVDLTPMIWQAFANLGSARPFPVIASFTGDGLRQSWPAAGTSMGGGWSVGAAASVASATWVRAGRYAVRYTDRAPEAKPQQEQLTSTTGVGTGTVPIQNNDAFIDRVPELALTGTLTTFGTITTPNLLQQLTAGFKTYDVLFDLNSFAFHFPAHYEASRSRVETLQFSLQADVQPLLVEAGADDEEALSLTSSAVAQPVDSGGALPIGDLRRNCYFKTDRGTQSLEFLLLHAAARLASRARAVDIIFSIDFDQGASITCRNSAHIIDPRIPGGEATGKVKRIELSLDSGSGKMFARVTIGCTVGYGGTVISDPGTGEYCDDDYTSEYQAYRGRRTEVISTQLNYQSMADFTVIDDDGVDFFNMTPGNVVQSLTVTGGYTEQKQAIDDQVKQQSPDPVGSLKLLPTRVELYLAPVAGGAFQTNFFVLTSKLMLPQTINLEAV